MGDIETVEETKPEEAQSEPAERVAGKTTRGGPSISKQQDRYGDLAQLLVFIENGGLHRLLRQAVIALLILVALLSLPVLWRIYYEFFQHKTHKLWLDVLKILFVYTFVSTIGGMIILRVYLNKIMSTLYQMEEAAFKGRDLARFYLPQARDELRHVRDRIASHNKEADAPSAADIAKTVMPVIGMLLKNEQNLLRWGMSGMKVYKTVSAFLKGKPGAN